MLQVVSHELNEATSYKTIRYTVSKKSGKESNQILLPFTVLPNHLPTKPTKKKTQRTG